MSTVLRRLDAADHRSCQGFQLGVLHDGRRHGALKTSLRKRVTFATDHMTGQPPDDCGYETDAKHFVSSDSTSISDNFPKTGAVEGFASNCIRFIP